MNPKVVGRIGASAGVSVSTRDKVDQAAARLSCVNDLLCAANAQELELSEQGLNGLWLILHDVATTMRDVASELSIR